MKLEGNFKEITGKEQWEQVNDTLHGHPGIVKICPSHNSGNEVSSTLYFRERAYPDMKTAFQKYKEDQFDLNPLCEDIYGDV